MTTLSRPKTLALFCGVLLLTFNTLVVAECTAPLWDNSLSYSRGDIVSYIKHEWRAKRNTNIGTAPGTHKPSWTDLGACESDTGNPPTEPPIDSTPLQILGVWHCGNTYCDWRSVRDMNEFHSVNQWIIEGRAGEPSVNLVILSFLEPLKLLNETNDDAFAGGIPKGMTVDVVNYFKDHGIRVMLSLGGVTYTDAWNEALTTNAEQLAINAFSAVQALGADGIEMDWENGTPSESELAGIEAFIEQYNRLRADQSEHFLTLDLAVGNRYLQELSRRASADWLPNGKIDYINAMVPRGEPSTDQWQEHVDGKSNYNPPILPKAPAKIAVSLWLTNGRRPNENCVNFENSTMNAKADYVQSVMPSGTGSTTGFLGFMFWAAECPATRNVCTTPPNSCEGGMGVAAEHFGIGPLEPLRTD